jgi:rhodanese-related sulfurtransferase
MNRLIFAALLMATLLTSCSGYDGKTFESVQAMVEDARGEAVWITTEQLASIIGSSSEMGYGSGFYLIDVREQSEFDLSCIKGATSVPRGLLENVISERAPGKRKPLYVYCSNGDRSALVAKILPLLKYSDVKVLEGGFDNWQTQYPDLVELAPVRGTVKAAVKKPATGCGG